MALLHAFRAPLSAVLSVVVAFSLMPLAEPSSAYAGEGVLAPSTWREVESVPNEGEDQAVSENAVLMANGAIYAASAAGAKEGPLAGSNDDAAVAAAIAGVKVLFVASNVKSIPASVNIAAGSESRAVALRQFPNLQKVTFLTSKAANAAAIEAANSAVSKATTAKRAADKKVKSAKAKYAAFNSLWKRRATLKKQGSLGYFTFYAQAYNDVGAKAAIKALKRQGYSSTDSNGKKFASFTHVGNAKDATSLANFERAVSLIPRGNALRTKDNHFKGRKALKVSDVIMAMSQSHANWSNSHLNHAGNCGSNYPVGENLAWNYDSDPYYQWYTEEKAAYEGRTSGQTGHYLNLMESSYASTGFAVCTYKSMYGWTTYCQQFNWGTIAGERLYTVAQYKKRIAAYKKFLSKGSAQVKAARKAYSAALATQKGAAGALAAAKAAKTAEGKRAVSACASIGANAFAGCAHLTTVVNFNKTLITSIGANAFKGCTRLSSITMPYSTLKTVGDGAFGGCGKLAVKPSVSISAKATVGSIKKQAFKNGKAVKPVPTVKVGKTALKNGTHFTVRYANNYAKGTACATVVGKGKYYGAKTVKFKIA